MPKHTVKVGDQFKLGAWEWKVVQAENKWFQAIVPEATEGEVTIGGWNIGSPTMKLVTFPLEDADKLDWIEPEMKFTKAEAEKVKRLLKDYSALPYECGKLHPSFEDFLDAHIEENI